MKGKAEIRFCALGFLCLVVIALTACSLSETAKGIRLAEGTSLAEGNSTARESQTEMVTAISGVSEMVRPQVHAGVYTMTAGETEMRFTNGQREIYAERTPNDYIGEAGPKGIPCVAVFDANGELLWWEEIAE